MKQLQTKFIMVAPHTIQKVKENLSISKKANVASVPLQIHSGKNQTLVIECRRGNQPKIDN